MNIDWKKAADGMADRLVQNEDGNVFFVNENNYRWDGERFIWSYDGSESFCILATRPKPKYTPEQVQAVTEFLEWAFDDGNGLRLDFVQLSDLNSVMAEWLKENNQ